MQGDLEASKSGAVLLTKDNNMCLKAQANGLKAVPPAHFPAAQPHLHKRLLAISSETSPIKHTPTRDVSPTKPPNPLSDLSLNPSQGSVTMPSVPGHSPPALGQSLSVPVPSKHAQHAQITTSSSHEFVHPADRLTQLGKMPTSDQSSASLHQQQARQTNPHLQQQEQHQQQQQHHQQLQQQLPQQLEDIAVGSFKLQGAPMLPPNLVTGSHGYPRAPFSTPPHLQLNAAATRQQQSDTGLGLGLGPQLDLGLQHGFAGLDSSMQHQQGGFLGNHHHVTWLQKFMSYFVPDQVYMYCTSSEHKHSGKVGPHQDNDIALGIAP